MNAWHVRVPLDDKYNHQGIVKFEEKSAHQRSLELADARSGHESKADGLDFMTKGYGGLEESTFKGIFSSQLDEAEGVFHELLNKIDSEGGSQSELYQEIVESLKKLPKVRDEIETGLKELDLSLIHI